MICFSNDLSARLSKSTRFYRSNISQTKNISEFPQNMLVRDKYSGSTGYQRTPDLLPSHNTSLCQWRLI